MKKIVLKSVLVIFGGVFMLSLFGCSANKYEIDYCGAKSSYQGTKSSYAAGEEVELYYKNLVPDMEYSFYLDGEYISPEFDAGGAVIRFVMPEHDVKLECRTKNSMSALQRECPNCHAFTPQASGICLSCGFDIEVTIVCPECGTELEKEAKFCYNCGSNLSDKE